MLELTRLQIFRLLRRYRQDGAAAIRHKARGKPPNNRIHKANRISTAQPEKPPERPKGREPER